MKAVDDFDEKTESTSVLVLQLLFVQFALVFRFRSGAKRYSG
jgi:hypothetical protein